MAGYDAVPTTSEPKPKQSTLRSQKEHIVALQHAIAQNHVANNVPLPPDLHACNGQAHGDPHAKAK